MISRTLLSIVVIVLWYVPSSHAVFKLVGSAVECDRAFAGCAPIPAQGIVVCPTTSACPTRLAPDYIVETRMWGTSSGQVCRVSNDRGVTWANCPTLPSLSSTSIAGAGDGGVLVVGTTGGNCQIHRSTNGGTSWSTVFDASVSGVGGTCSTSSSSSMIKCTIDNECVFTYDVSGSTVYRAIISEDYGQTWTVGGASSALGISAISMAFSGLSANNGIASTAGGGRAFRQSSTSTWSSTAIWAGTGLCWGSIIYNGAEKGLCSTTGGSVVHTLRTGSTGATERTLTMPDVYPTGDVNSGIHGQAYATNVAYVIGTVNKLVSGQLIVGVWVTTDDFTTMIKLFETNQPTGPLREGDIFIHQGCIWFSGGMVASMIGKVC